jgi:hypothetical protein
MSSMTTPPTRKASIAPSGPAWSSQLPMAVTQPTPIMEPKARAKKLVLPSRRWSVGLAFGSAPGAPPVRLR